MFISTYIVLLAVDVTSLWIDLIIKSLSFRESKVVVLNTCPLLPLAVTLHVSECLNLHTLAVDALTLIGSISCPSIKFISVDFPELVSPKKMFLCVLSKT